MPGAFAETLDIYNPEIAKLVSDCSAEIKVWNQTWEAVLRGAGAPTGQTAASSAVTTSRVLCQPQFDESERPIDFMKVFSFPEDQIIAYETLTEPLEILPGEAFLFRF